MSVEYSNRPRGINTFPPEWGVPEGRAMSEERVAWALRNIGFTLARRRTRSATVALARATAEANRL